MKQFLKGLGVGLACLVTFVLGVVFNTQFLGIKSKGIFMPKTSFELTKDLVASKSLPPSLFNARLSFFSSDSRLEANDLNTSFKQELTGEMDSIQALIKKSKLCSGGSYDLRPNFSYDKGVKMQKGWVFDANFSCAFKTQKSFDDLLASFNTKVLSYSTSAVKSELSKQSKDEAIKTLQEQLLKEALEEAKLYSSRLNKDCELGSLEYNSFAPALYRTSLPIDQEKELSQSARVIFKCK